MKAEVVKGWPRNNAIRILLKDTDSSQVNAIRRALISDVPKLAITRVNITQGVVENDGQIMESVNVLPDEVLPNEVRRLDVVRSKNAARTCTCTCTCHMHIHTSAWSGMNAWSGLEHSPA